MKFVRCIDSCGDVILVNLQCVEIVARIDRPEREDVVYTTRGTYYEVAPEYGGTALADAVVDV